MPRALVLPLLTSLALGCNAQARAVDPRSDAPEVSAAARAQPFVDAASYALALQAWRTPEDVNAWIGARFEYDTARAMQLSETQRARSGGLPIHAPGDFFAAPSGVCVDLSRFAVETLRAVAPQSRPRYLMIEFAPVTIAGNALRLHWVVVFERDGALYVFADSKRPGHISGPHASTRDFIDAYAGVRERQIVAFREVASYQRSQRKLAAKQSLDVGP